MTLHLLWRFGRSEDWTSSPVRTRWLDPTVLALPSCSSRVFSEEKRGALGDEGGFRHLASLEAKAHAEHMLL